MKLQTLLLLGIAAMLATSRTEAAPQGKPNIVLIVADDLGYGDLGSFGCKDIPTPAIDSLAKQGACMRQNYAYNVCSPSRAAIATGRYAERSGFRGALMGKSVPEFANAHTLAQALKKAGYRTGLVGKWHLGYEGATIPTKMGFDEFFGHLGGKIDYYEHIDSTQKKHDLWEGEKEVTLDGYSTDLFTERACKFIDEHASTPFFLQVNYNAPHYSRNKGNYQAPPKWEEKFKALGLGNGKRGSYAAMVGCMDAGIGQMLAKLDSKRLSDNTLIIFVSDNGAEDAGSNAPLNGGKYTNREGGIRVPMIVRWLGHSRPGSEVQVPTHVIDIMPTILEATGAKTTDPLDGQSLLPLLAGKTLPERPLFFQKYAVRLGKWKLDNGKLYDLSTDITESKNLFTEEPETVAKLQGELKKWRQTFKR